MGVEARSYGQSNAILRSSVVKASEDRHIVGNQQLEPSVDLHVQEFDVFITYASRVDDITAKLDCIQLVNDTRVTVEEHSSTLKSSGKERQQSNFIQNLVKLQVLALNVPGISKDSEAQLRDQISFNSLLIAAVYGPSQANACCKLLLREAQRISKDELVNFVNDHNTVLLNVKLQPSVVFNTLFNSNQLPVLAELLLVSLHEMLVIKHKVNRVGLLLGQEYQCNNC